jgi:CBS domain-containing membrane protein
MIDFDLKSSNEKGEETTSLNTKIRFEVDIELGKDNGDDCVSLQECSEKLAHNLMEESKIAEESTTISACQSTASTNFLQAYFRKFSGVEGKTPPPMTKSLEIPVSSSLAFIGLFLVTITDYFFLTKNFYANHDEAFAIAILSGAHGATSVILYEAYQAPFAQPRNVLGGYLVSSFLGVSTRLICDIPGVPQYVVAPLAVAVAMLGMNLTKTIHPPGGAVALLAVIGGKTILGIGYGYCLVATGGAFVMLCWACIGNNLIPSRQYPSYWY